MINNRIELFSPLQIGPVTIKNRIAIPPMCMYRAKSGLVQIFHKVHYGSLVCSGAGLLTIEATAIRPDGRITDACLGLWSDECEAALKRMLEVMHDIAPDVKVFIQLNHAGRKASTSAASGEPLKPLYGGWGTLAPSPIAFAQDWPTPKELLPEEIEDIEQAFVNAAQRAVRAGIDGIMIHAAHGYLIHEFLSPLSNHRIDEYGGALEGRMRFGLEIMRRVKLAVPANVAVGVRVSATDWVDDGLQPDDVVTFLNHAKAQGCDFVDVSTGGLIRADIPVAPGYQVPFASEIKKATGLPTIAAGLITEPVQAETILRSGEADAVDIGRAMLRDPRWGWHAAQALGVEGLVMPNNVAFGYRS